MPGTRRPVLQGALSAFPQPTAGASATYYDSSHHLERVEVGPAVHVYSFHSGYVTIEANTQPRTRMTIDLDANEMVETVTLEVEQGLSGWRTAWEAGVGWSGSVLSSVSLAPRGSTSSFVYYGEGSLAEVEDCSGRVWKLRYEEGT